MGMRKDDKLDHEKGVRAKTQLSLVSPNTQDHWQPSTVSGVPLAPGDDFIR